MRIFFAFAFLTVLLSPGLGSAQDRRQAARADFQAGIASLEAGEFAIAELSFRRSLAAFPTTAAQCNLALTYDRWGGHVTEALAAYQACAEQDSSSSGHYYEHAVARSRELRDARAAARAGAQAPVSAPPPEEAPRAPNDDAVAPVLAPTRPGPAPAPTYSYTPAPAERSPSRAFLWLGLASTVLAGAAIVSAAALATAANDDADSLAAGGYRMADGRYLIPADDPGVRTLDDAQSKSSASVGLYVAGGVLGALGITFFVLQVATSKNVTEIAVSPIEGGASVSARLRL